MAWAVDFANKTPFETDAIVEATVRLSAYGLEAQKVMPAIGDMAAVMNKDVMQAVEAVADAQENLAMAA
jgi:phage tail tape-measure protein